LIQEKSGFSRCQKLVHYPAAFWFDKRRFG